MIISSLGDKGMNKQTLYPCLQNEVFQSWEKQLNDMYKSESINDLCFSFTPVPLWCFLPLK